MPPRFSWYAPTHGDARLIGGRSPDLAWTPAYIDGVAVAAEAAGFDSILLPVGPGCADAMVSATHIALATERLRCIVACRPGSQSPTVLAKAAATLDHVSDGRVSLNVVTGGSPMELAMDGDHEPHDRRYARTREFMAILRAVWSGDAVDYRGEFFRIVEASLEPKPVQPSGPPLYLGGSSEAAVRTAAEEADVYLMWGEPSEAVGEQIARVRAACDATGRTLSFGMRINLIVEEEREAAWERAGAMVAGIDEAMASRASRYLANSDSTAVSRIQALRGADHGDPAFWTGMVAARSGNSTALVGSPGDVVASLRRYVDAGVTEFIFSAYPHGGDSPGFVGEHVVPELRSYVHERVKGA